MPFLKNIQINFLLVLCLLISTNSIAIASSTYVLAFLNVKDLPILIVANVPLFVPVLAETELGDDRGFICIWWLLLHPCLLTVDSMSFSSSFVGVPRFLLLLCIYHVQRLEKQWQSVLGPELLSHVVLRIIVKIGLPELWLILRLLVLGSFNAV